MPTASAERVEDILTRIVSVDDSPLEMLVSLFPTADRGVLTRMLMRAEGSVDEAAAAYHQSLEDQAIVERLATEEKESHERELAAERARAAELDRLCMAGGEYHDYTDDGDDFGEEGEDASEFGAAMYARGKKARASLKRRGGPAPRPTKHARPVVRLEDKPAQSLLCVPRLVDAEAHIGTAIGTDSLAALSARCFTDMVCREQELWGTHVCFYHSYSFAAIIYEVQAAIARGLYDLPMSFAPLPRLLKKPFDGRPTMDMLMEDFKRMPAQDHNAEFRAVAISVSCSLFGFGSEAPPLSCFRSGYSCTDLSFRGALEHVLVECGLPRRELDSVINRVVEVSNRYGLMGNYAKHSDPRRHPLMLGMGGARSAGHMLQIFVRKDVVDHIAYRSEPMGVPIKSPVPISVFLSGEGTARASRVGDPSGPCNGQARIFMHPAVFTDPTASQIFHYCANEEFMNPDPTKPGSRGAYVQELHAALAPILGSADGLRRAFCGVEALREAARAGEA
jgi:hypothetical protein